MPTRGAGFGVPNTPGPAHNPGFNAQLGDIPGRIFAAERGTTVEAVTSTSMTVTVTGNTVVGNTLVLFVGGRGSFNVSSVTDTRSNTWTVDLNAPDATANNALGVCSAPITTQLLAGDTVTINFSGSVGPSRAAMLEEFTGLVTASPVDKTASAASSSATPSSGTTAATTQDNELAVAVFCAQIIGSVGWSKDSSYLYFPTPELHTLGAASTDRSLHAEYRLVASQVAQSATARIWTPGGPFAGNSGIVTYKLAAVGATTIIVPTAAVGTGAADAPTIESDEISVTATGSGSSATPTLVETVLPATATGTGSATPPVSLNLSAATATGTGTASAPLLFVTFLPATSTGTGSSGAPTLLAAITSATATGTGQAIGPAALELSTGTASGTGSAPAPTLLSTLTSVTPTGTGAAGTPTIAGTIIAAAATGTGSAGATLADTETGVTAIGTGSAASPTLEADILAATATGTGSAGTPTLDIFTGVSAPAATGTGAAIPPGLEADINPPTASGAGVASGDVVYFVYPPTATGSGQAYFPAGFTFEGVGTGTTPPTGGGGGAGGQITVLGSGTARRLFDKIEPDTARGHGGAHNPQIITETEPLTVERIIQTPIRVDVADVEPVTEVTVERTRRVVETIVRDNKTFLASTALGKGMADAPILSVNDPALPLDVVSELFDLLA